MTPNTMSILLLGWLSRLGYAATALFVAGCQGMYIHDTDRAATAATAKKNVDAVDIGAISKTEQENVAKLLQEELRSVDTRENLVAHLAVIELAASEQS